ncbi:MAG TPA: hypothetical protein VF072_05015 [Thermoleophilaceae bacterium]
MTRPRRRLALGLVAMSAALLALGLAGIFAAPGRAADTDTTLGAISFVFPIAAFSVVGALIAVRHPANAIGWLLATIGLLWAIVLASAAVATWGLETGDLPRSVAEWIDVGSNVWVIGLGLLGTQLPLRLPDGRLPSPRWRWFSRASAGLIAITLVGMATHQGRVEGYAGTANPLGAAWAEPLAAAIFLLIACFLIAISTPFRRYRHADELERVQLRWVAFGGAVFLAVYLLTLLLPGILGLGEHSTGASLITAFSQAAFAAPPIAIGYAILRHRLYDIDVVINRALVYGALTAILAGTYVGTVLLLQLVLSPSSNFAIAASTLAVAGLFYPVRARIQGVVDRRFFRHKYDAQRTVDNFSARLRDELDLAALSGDLRAVVCETLQPAHMSLWLREQP